MTRIFLQWIFHSQWPLKLILEFLRGVFALTNLFEKREYSREFPKSNNTRIEYRVTPCLKDSLEVWTVSGKEARELITNFNGSREEQARSGKWLSLKFQQLWTASYVSRCITRCRLQFLFMVKIPSFIKKKEYDEIVNRIKFHVIIHNWQMTRYTLAWSNPNSRVNKIIIYLLSGVTYFIVSLENNTYLIITEFPCE